MILLVNDVHQELILQTMEPLFALNVVVDLKPMNLALLVNSVLLVFSALMMANVNYVPKTKFLIQLEAADAILVELVLNQTRIKHSV